MISFNKPLFSSRGLEYIYDAIVVNHRLNGDGPFTQKCTEWFESKLCTKALLTTSCTHALEMAAILLDIKEGDEVIMPSFTFVSTADAFVLRGARIKFVDIRKDTMNINETLIENAITRNTRAIVVVHYAGVACDMDPIIKLAREHGLHVVEDAAQGMMASYKEKQLGTIGTFGAYSFHETKNYTMGEGGLILVNDSEYNDRAEIIREKGTNRSKFFRGEIDKYSWVDIGSSYLPSEMGAAYLFAQLECAEEIYERRMRLWEAYFEGLSMLEKKGYIDLPVIPDYSHHNAHMFYLKTKDLDERTKLIYWLKQKGINAVFHYVPLHSSIAGCKFGEFVGDDIFTTSESERILRLPMHDGLSLDEVFEVCARVEEFYNQ